MRLPFILIAASSLALAQTATLEQSNAFRGVNLPPTSAAFADESTAIAVNPAGLSSVQSAELFYLHERAVLRGQTADGLYLADSFGGVGMGISEEWIRGAQPGYRKTAWGVSLGGPNLALGAAFNFFASDDNYYLNQMASVDLGAIARPFRFLSLGAVIKNLNAPVRPGIAFDRQYDFALGLRPLGERLNLGVDWLFPQTGGIQMGRLGYSLQAELLRGVVLNAGVSHGFRPGDDVLFQLGIALNTAHLGVGYTAGAGPSGIDHLIAVRVSAQAYPALSLNSGRVALLDLGARLTSPLSSLGQLLGLSEEDPYLRLLRFLDDAGRDPELRGVVLKIDSLPQIGLAKVDELRQAIFKLRASGKRVVAVTLMAGNAEYLVASAADKVYALSESLLLINGLSAGVTFVGGTMEKIGVHWDVARVGAYKNAPDQLTRSQMSSEQRESINAYLDTDVAYYETAMKVSRQISPEKLQTILAEGMLPARRAMTLGLVDEVITSAQLETRLGELIPGAEYDASYSPLAQRNARWAGKRKIAVVPVIGDIGGGKTRPDSLTGGVTAGAETVLQALKKAEEDPSVVAIVVRVDSHGGEVLASDLMYRAVLEAKSKKPVVASMGDVAASGGYYAAMGADEIFAAPTTITGSIGVFAVKPALAEVAGKLGVNHEVIKRGPLTEVLSLFRPWNDEERAAAQKWVDASYDDFITEVANSRHLAKDKVDAIARGRVWSGQDAKSRGLVDQLGGLEDAIASARKRAGVSPQEDLDVVTVTDRQGLMSITGTGEEFVSLLLDRAIVPPSALESNLSRLASELGLSSEMLKAPSVQAVMPFALQVR